MILPRRHEAGERPHDLDEVASACRTAGFSMQVAHEVDNLQSAYGLVAAGLGVAFVPHGLQLPPKGVVLKSLAPQLPGIDCEIALVYRRERVCALVGLFVDVVNEIRSGRPKRRRSA